MNRKRLITILAALTLALVLAGCGASGSAKDSGYEPGYAANDNSAQAAYGSGSMSGGFYYEDGDYDYEVAAEDPAYEKIDNSNSRSEDTTPIEKADSNEKLVYTCSIRMETTDYEQTMDAIKKSISDFGGIIQNEEQSDSNSQWYYSDYVKSTGTLYAQIVVRIPSAKYFDFLDSLEGTGKITRQYQNVENISRKYNDTSATIEALETQQSRLLDMLKQAETVEDMIMIEDRLTDVEAELNYYKTLLSSMDTDVEYSTVTIEVNEVMEYSKDKDPVKTSTFGDRLKNVLNDTWSLFKSVGEWLLYAIIYTAPFVIAGGIIALIIILIVRGAKKSRLRKRQAKAENNQQ